jgi:hypothetical protein
MWILIKRADSGWMKMPQDLSPSNTAIVRPFLKEQEVVASSIFTVHKSWFLGLKTGRLGALRRRYLVPIILGLKTGRQYCFSGSVANQVPTILGMKTGRDHCLSGTVVNGVNYPYSGNGCQPDAFHRETQFTPAQRPEPRTLRTTNWTITPRRLLPKFVMREIDQPGTKRVRHAANIMSVSKYFGAGFRPASRLFTFVKIEQQVFLW